MFIDNFLETQWKGSTYWIGKVSSKKEWNQKSWDLLFILTMYLIICMTLHKSFNLLGLSFLSYERRGQNKVISIDTIYCHYSMIIPISLTKKKWTKGRLLEKKVGNSIECFNFYCLICRIQFKNWMDLAEKCRKFFDCLNHSLLIPPLTLTAMVSELSFEQYFSNILPMHFN